MPTATNNQTRSKYTEDFLPIREINNNCILLNNKEKVTGIKIMPKNIFIMGPEMMNSVISNLRVVYNLIDYEFWIISADRPVDISVYMSQLELLYQNEQDPVRKKLIMQDIRKGEQFMQNDVVDTEFFLLFKEKNDETIQKRIRNLINNFANAGLATRQVSNEDLRVLMDNFFNAGKSTKFGTVMS
ncbi:MAG: hypothetical protein IJB71_00420 [Bacilli bacterium]|nr:hypothetical protein [Bacilli bacterium]